MEIVVGRAGTERSLPGRTCQNERMGTDVSRVSVDGVELTTARWGTGVPEIVLLHHGLGSVGQWRSVPAGLLAATGRCTVAYDRPGHGTSTPVPDGPWSADWLHREAGRLGALLDRLGVERSVLVGHSDGASVALIFAAEHPERVEQVVSIAAHSYVEQICVDRIAQLRAEPDGLIDGLAKYHADPAAVFEAWSGVWVSDEFARWDIRSLIGAVRAPTVVIQGRDDEYGTDAMAIDTAAAIGENARLVLLDGLGHLVPQQAPDVVIDLVVEALAGGE